jgi:CRP/FNR family transcriptional regulator
MRERPEKQGLQSSLDCNARESCLFAGLDGLRLTKLERIQRRDIYPGGSMIFAEGEEPQGIYCICSGRVKLSIYSFDGRAMIMGTATSGDLIGINALMSEKLHILTAESLELAQLCFINKDNFLDFLGRNADIGLKLAKKLSNELYETYSAVRDVKFKRSYERLAELLLRLCDSRSEATPDGIMVKISFSRDDLAEMIGTSTRTLTRILMKLKYLRIIECRRQQFLIRDRAALENIIAPVNLF